MVIGESILVFCTTVLLLLPLSSAVAIKHCVEMNTKVQGPAALDTTLPKAFCLHKDAAAVSPHRVNHINKYPALYSTSHSRFWRTKYFIKFFPRTPL